MQSLTDAHSNDERAALTASRLVSVNVGTPRTIRWLDRTVTSAIWKEPIAGPISLRGVNLDGDDQADRQAHGGLTKPSMPTHSTITASGLRSSVLLLSPDCSGKT